MRRMSFSATVEQMHSCQKTVTRRDPNTWKNLKAGDRLMAVEKAMGLAKGDTQQLIGEIEIVPNRVEPIVHLDDDEVTLEGFPHMTAEDFIDEVWRPIHGMPKSPMDRVRRIEFRHVGKPEVLSTRNNEVAP